MNYLKKTIAVLMAALIATVGMGEISASATSWSASHANYPGAPSNEGVSPTITVKHRKAGATAICNYATHTNSTAITGYTYIHCANYSMTTKTIKNTNKATCNPDVGTPTVDISVQYRISAYTPTSSDTFNSKGNITKIG